MATNEEWAYLAGIVDGEGSIGLYINSNGHQPTISVGQKREILIDWILERFPGTKVVLENYGIYRWTTSARKHLIPILEGIRPYLVMKGPQADIVLEYLATMEARNNKPISDEVAMQRALLIVRIQTLNDNSGKKLP
jgi:hypothetical protein